MVAPWSIASPGSLMLSFGRSRSSYARTNARAIPIDGAATGMPKMVLERARAEVSTPRTCAPHTADVAAEMAAYGSDRHYALMLDQLLLGIRSAAAARVSRPASRVRRTPPAAPRSAGTPRPLASPEAGARG